MNAGGRPRTLAVHEPEEREDLVAGCLAIHGSSENAANFRFQ